MQVGRGLIHRSGEVGGLRGYGRTAWASWRIWVGRVRQQPPTSRAPASIQEGASAGIPAPSPVECQVLVTGS
mgnify:CR=1 FL=1